MSKLTGLKQQIAAYLTSHSEFADTDVLTAYPGRERVYPLPRAAVAVGIDAVELVPAGLGGYLGESGAETLYGGNAAITLRFDLYCPPNEGGQLHALYEELCGALMLEQNPFGVTKLWCGETRFDTVVSANCMAVRGTLSAALLREAEEKRFTAAELKKRSEELSDNR